MKQKITALFLCIIMLCSIHLPTWANIEDSKNNQIYSIDNNFFTIEKPYQLAEKQINRKGFGAHSILWIANFFIPGLAQIISGQILRGLSFWLYYILAAFSMALVGSAANLPTEPVFAFLSLIYLIIYIWSIVDAYRMGQDIENETVSNNSEVLASIENKILVLNQTINKIQYNNNSVNYSVLTF